MNIASQHEVAANFADYLKASQKGPVIVTDNGEPVAVLLKATEKDDLERLLMGHSEKLQAILDAARQRFKEGRGIPHDAFWEQVAAQTAKQRPMSKRTRAKNGRSKRGSE
ncbi:MAG TPA: type II toxin-antitoxin system Phd/YefM family antitoxin [Pirellulales bacterium]